MVGGTGQQAFFFFFSTSCICFVMLLIWLLFAFRKHVRPCLFAFWKCDRLVVAWWNRFCVPVLPPVLLLWCAGRQVPRRLLQLGWKLHVVLQSVFQLT